MLIVNEFDLFDASGVGTHNMSLLLLDADCNTFHRCKTSSYSWIIIGPSSKIDF